MIRKLLGSFRRGDDKVSQPDAEVCDTCKDLGSTDPGPVAFTETLLGETRRYCEGHHHSW